MLKVTKNRLLLDYSRSTQRLLIILAAMGMLSGCNMTKQYEGLSKLDTRPPAPAAVERVLEKEPKEVANKGGGSPTADEKKSTSSHAWSGPVSKLQNTDGLTSAFTGSSSNYRSTEQISDSLSAHCRRILAETGIEATILRSPSLNGSINTDNDLSVGASFDLIDLKRANLKEEMALARCKRDSASLKLTQLLVTSSQSLTRAGYLAKSNSLRRHAGTFARIKSTIKNGLHNGNLTRLRANSLRQYIQQVKSGEARARGEAAKREVVDRIQKRNFRNLDKQLLYAEQHMQAISARTRTADAVKFKASVTYSQAGSASNDLTISQDGEVTAKISVSMRLGAFYGRRDKLEDVASQARLASLYEEDRGMLWRTHILADANLRVLKSFRDQRASIVRALAEAKHNARRGPTEYEPELLMPQLRARIDILSLQADLAGLDATIADTRRVDAKLRFRR